MSSWRKASCGAHVDTAYLQGNAVFLRAFSSRGRSIAAGRVPGAVYASCWRATPHWSAERAAPAGRRQAVTWALCRANAVWEARVPSLRHPRLRGA